MLKAEAAWTFNPTSTVTFLIIVVWLGFPVMAAAQPRVAISEIMYHPVERPAFNADGGPLLDLSKDVHEFVELHNPGARTISLKGWRLSGGISYRFPPD